MKVDNTDNRRRFYIHEEWTDDAESEGRRWCFAVI